MMSLLFPSMCIILMPVVISGSEKTELDYKLTQLRREIIEIKDIVTASKTELDYKLTQLRREIIETKDIVKASHLAVTRLAKVGERGCEIIFLNTFQEAPQLVPERTVLETARKLRLQGKHDEAAKLYADFIENRPNSSRLYEARFWMAKSLFAYQKWDESSGAFTEFLKHHSDQRKYAIQAKEDRIYCWSVLYKKEPKAVLGLKNELKDQNEDIRILAALALAENKDVSGRKVLEDGLNDNAKFSEQCSLALWRLGVRKQPKAGEASPLGIRMIVIKVKTVDDSFEMRVPVNLITGVEKMLPAEVRNDNELERMSDILSSVASAPKGQILYQYKSKNGKSSVIITVD